MRDRTALLLPAIVIACACAPASLPPPDAPVPAGEPRAELRLSVDLDRARDCEEAFELALYRDRAVDLVTWEPPRDRCDGRVVVVRYLSARTTRDAVLAAAARASKRATPAAAPPARTP